MALPHKPAWAARANAPGRARTGELRYPDFICIGAQKAGTSWLDHNLRRHPRLWLPPIKELQYFSQLYLPETRKWTTRHRVEAGARALKRYTAKTPLDEWDDALVARTADIANGAASDEWYGGIFSLAPAGRICGEVTPDYSTLPEEGVRHIVRLSPAVKIIFLMRDPIERSWSHIRMMMKTRRITDLPAIEQMARNREQVRRADYAAIIDTWTKIIPRARFHTVLTEDISERSAEALGGICAFLGIAYREKLFRKAGYAIHVGAARPMPPSVAAILKERLRPAYEAISARYPEIGATWMARHFG
jgi:hypothetical protein